MDIQISLSDFEKDFKKKSDRLKLHLPNLAAGAAVNFYTRSFNEQKMIGKPRWKKRVGNTDPGRNILIGKGSGALRRSIRARISGTGQQATVEIYTHLPYADAHNEGATITPTAKQRKFFWAKHYEAKETAEASKPKREKSKGTKKYQKANSEADMWLGMALAKKIEIPQRQFMDIQREGISLFLERYIKLQAQKFADDIMPK
jgi:phage gpG-like protein